VCRRDGSASWSGSRGSGDSRDHRICAVARPGSGTHIALGDVQATSALFTAAGSLGETSQH
jgi:hypothetical protein